MQDPQILRTALTTIIVDPTPATTGTFDGFFPPATTNLLAPPASAAVSSNSPTTSATHVLAPPAASSVPANAPNTAAFPVGAVDQFDGQSRKRDACALITTWILPLSGV